MRGTVFSTFALPAALVLSLASTAAQAELNFHWRLKGMERMGGVEAGQALADDPQAQDATPLALDENGFLPSATYGEPYQFSLVERVSDGDSADLTWSGTDLPGWLSLDSGSGVLSGTPSTADTGEQGFTIAAAGSDGSVSKDYTLKVGGSVLAASQISTGRNFSCVATPQKTAACWGYNAYGQLGDGSTLTRQAPVPVLGLSDVQELSTGYGHVCARTSAGQIYCWGQNNRGQLGNGQGGSFGDLSSTPVSIQDGDTYKLVASGDEHTCGITTAGVTKCWGQNMYGQIGNGDKGWSASVSAPVEVLGNHAFTMISNNYQHNCAIDTDGAVWCWGGNRYGQLGDGTSDDKVTPVQVQGITNAVHVSVSESHSCAVLASGDLKCWGNNSKGQLGNGNTTESWVPVTAQISDVSRVHAGDEYTCAVVGDGEVKCWGANLNGQLGNGTFTNSMTPQTVQDLAHVAELSDNGPAYANGHVCAITKAGDVKCWGDNQYGELGDGTTQNRPYAVETLGF